VYENELLERVVLRRNFELPENEMKYEQKNIVRLSSDYVRLRVLLDYFQN